MGGGGGREGDEMRWTLGVGAFNSLLASDAAALGDVVQWTECVAVASVEYLDCDIWRRSSAASNAWQV